MDPLWREVPCHRKWERGGGECSQSEPTNQTPSTYPTIPDRGIFCRRKFQLTYSDPPYNRTRKKDGENITIFSTNLAAEHAILDRRNNPFGSTHMRGKSSHGLIFFEKKNIQSVFGKRCARARSIFFSFPLLWSHAKKSAKLNPSSSSSFCFPSLLSRLFCDVRTDKERGKGKKKRKSGESERNLRENKKKMRGGNVWRKVWSNYCCVFKGAKKTRQFMHLQLLRFELFWFFFSKSCVPFVSISHQ